MSSIKIRAKEAGGSAAVKCLIKHPMEGGRRKDKKTGDFIPPHHITELEAEHNGNKVYTALFSGSVSKNPYLSFRISGAAKGDTLKIKWVDNKGESDEKEAKIK